MTKSTDDTKKDFSAKNNRFLIDMNGVLKVRCLDCRKECQCIPLPRFSMYFCDDSFCENTLELRYYDKGGLELHDYGGIFNDKDFAEGVEKRLEELMPFVMAGMPKPGELK